MTCAFAVRGALKKFPGVESVDVSLNKGLATVKLKPGNGVTPETLWEAVKKSGFTAKDTHVVVRGEVSVAYGKLELKVSVVNRVYELTGAKPPVQGKTVTVEGSMIPGKDLTAPVPIRVQEAKL